MPTHPQAFIIPDASRFQVKKATTNVLPDFHQPNYIAKLRIPPKLVTKNSTTTLFTCQSFIISEVISSSKNSHLKTPPTWIELHIVLNSFPSTSTLYLSMMFELTHIHAVLSINTSSSSWNGVLLHWSPLVPFKD